MPSKEVISQWFKELQSRICEQLELADGKGRFLTDLWERPGGGGGTSRATSRGNVIESGGVIFSARCGDAPAPTLKLLNMGAISPAPRFFATGVSVVIHPFSPRVP